jgi:hypothetical protein
LFLLKIIYYSFLLLLFLKMTIIKSKNGRIITYESKKKYKEEEI